MSIAIAGVIGVLVGWSIRSMMVQAQINNAIRAALRALHECDACEDRKTDA